MYSECALWLLCGAGEVWGLSLPLADLKCGRGQCQISCRGGTPIATSRTARGNGVAGACRALAASAAAARDAAFVATVAAGRACAARMRHFRLSVIGVGTGGERFTTRRVKSFSTLG